jgi:hypothetical protein
MKYRFIVLLLVKIVLSVQAIDWQQDNWAFSCDFIDNDLSNSRVRGEDCGGLCVKTSSCTHFTWTTYNGGTCWMKTGTVSKDDAFNTNDDSMVCGIVGVDTTTTSSPSDGITLYNIYSTRHGATEQGACALPSVDYNVLNPVALGDIGELGYLQFSPDLCGHILRINCGNGDLDIIVTNSNLGGGLDLYESTWDMATNKSPPGVTRCSVQLTSQNPIRNSGPICYYIQGEGFNEWYHNVALLNTDNRIVNGATLNGKTGAHRGANPYYAFDVRASGSDQVTFELNDGSSQRVFLRDCVKGVTAKQDWN